jgi:branched-chain amino acid transport system permease protein
MSNLSIPSGQSARTSELMQALGKGFPFLIVLAVAVLLPFVGSTYWVSIGARAAIYWVLCSGLNLIVGYAGQLAIGYVALLTIGAYTTSILVAGNVMSPLPSFVAVAGGGLAGGLSGLIIGLPALRLRTFYFAMTTVGFATIILQVVLAWQDVTGGGIGVPGPAFPAPFDTSTGFYVLCFAAALLCTIFTANLAYSRVGRSLLAIRDKEVVAEAMGISKAKSLAAIFFFAGILAGIAGGFFASLQTYITPDAFTFDLSILFFISILIGGRGSIIGPLIGTIVLTVLPEFAAPLAAWSTFLFALMLLVIVLAIPGGIASLLDWKNRKPLRPDRNIMPNLGALDRILDRASGADTLDLREVTLNFGGLRAIDRLDLKLSAGTVHGLIGPNGSGKTTTLNVISGYYRPQEGTVTIGARPLAFGEAGTRAAMRVARTFQTPHIIGEMSVVDNVMIGGNVDLRTTFLEALISLPRQRREERDLHEKAMVALNAVGLSHFANVRADRLQHSELRFVEIARALMIAPAFLLLDEPAAGLSAAEIRQLASLIKEISRHGVGVLLVEHHAELIFDICDHVTVLNLGRRLAEGTPASIRTHQEVISAYLGQ